MQIGLTTSGLQSLQGASASGLPLTSSGQRRNGCDIRWFEIELDPSYQQGTIGDPPGQYTFGIQTDISFAASNYSYKLATANDAAELVITPPPSSSAGQVGSVVLNWDPATTSARVRLSGRGLGYLNQIQNSGRKIIDVHYWKGIYTSIDFLFNESPATNWSATDEPDWSFWVITFTPTMFGKWAAMNEPKILNWDPSSIGTYYGWFQGCDAMQQPIDSAWNLQPVNGVLSYERMFYFNANPIVMDSGAVPTKVRQMYTGSGITDQQIQDQLVYWNSQATIPQNVDGDACFAVSNFSARFVSMTSYAAAKSAYDNLANTHGWNWGANNISWVP